MGLFAKIRNMAGLRASRGRGPRKPGAWRLSRSEAASTKRGIAAHRLDRTRVAQSSFLLRRNIHRLEKGLAMPTRRSVFALDFIAETVELHALLDASPTADQAELKWAHDVLERYFAVVDHEDPRIAMAFSTFQAGVMTRSHPADQSATRFTPYLTHALSDQLGCHPATVPDAQSFRALCRARRSMRWFEDKPVPEATLSYAMESALQAPSACNRQPFMFYAIHARETIRQVAAMPLGTKGFGDDLPVLIAVIGDLSAFAEPRDRHLIYIDSSLASMQLMLALTAAGLGSVPINWPDIPRNHDALRDVLGLKPHHVPIMLIGVGIPKPDALICYSSKKTVETVMSHVN